MNPYASDFELFIRSLYIEIYLNNFFTKLFTLSITDQINLSTSFNTQSNIKLEVSRSNNLPLISISIQSKILKLNF